MVSRSDRGLASALTDLHDVLWAGRRTDRTKLLARVAQGTDVLDRRIGARGSLRASVRPLVRGFPSEDVGADLFTFLSVVADLDAAVRASRRSPRRAAKIASELAVTLCIHTASAADRFDLVREFEAGSTDFATFTSRLAEALEQRGVVRAWEFRRAVEVTFDVNALWDGRTGRDVQRVAAASAVASVAFASCLLVDSLRALGRYRDPPYGRLPALVARILGSAGGHP